MQYFYHLFFFLKKHSWFHFPPLLWPISTPWNRWIYLLSPISFFLFKLIPDYAHAKVLLPSSPMISTMKIHVPFLTWISNIWHGWTLFPPWNTFFAWLSGHIFPRASSQSLSCCFLITQPLNDGILSGLLALELHFPLLVYMYIHIYRPVYHDSYLGHAICNQTILNLSSLTKGSHSRYLSTVGCLGGCTPHCPLSETQADRAATIWSIANHPGKLCPDCKSFHPGVRHITPTLL